MFALFLFLFLFVFVYKGEDMLDSSIDGPNPNTTNGGPDQTIEQLHRQVSGYEGSTLGQPSKNHYKVAHLLYFKVLLQKR